MSQLTIISRRTLSDAAGTYTAYTYADGHITTDPPNRPVSKEDLQRQVRDKLAQDQATRSLANDRARFTKTQAQQLAPNAQQIARAEFDVINGGLVTAGISKAIRTFTKFAATATAPDAYTDQVVASVALGGELVKGGTEFVATTPLDANQVIETNNYAVVRHPLELRREPS